MSCISQGSSDIVQVRLASLQFSYVKFPQDSIHQNYWNRFISPSYLTYKGVETGVYIDYITCDKETDIFDIHIYAVHI